MIGDVEQEGVERLAADVVERDVDPVGAQVAEARHHVLAAVVDDRVEPGLVAQPRAFLVAPGDADHAAAADLRDLRGNAAGRTRGARDDDGLALARLADVEQAEVGGQARHAEAPERVGQVAALGHASQARDAVGSDDRIVLPAEEAVGVVARLPLAVLRCNDLPDGARAHHLADCDRRHVVGRVLDPAAHGGLEGQVQIAHEHLPVLDRGHRRLDELEVALLDHAFGPPGQHPLSVHVAHVRAPVRAPGSAAARAGRIGRAASVPDAA